MTNRKKTLWSILAALISGVLLSFCFPGWDISQLVWVWMLPLFPAIWRGTKKRYGFFIGYLAGLAFWLINLKWLWTVSGLGAVIMAAFLATYFGIWGAIAVSIGNPWRKREVSPEKQKLSKSKIQEKIEAKNSAIKKSPLQISIGESALSLKFAFINAAAWVGLEWLRGWVFTGFSWNGLGTAFHSTPVLAQAADLIGLTGLAFLPVFMSAVLIQTGKRFIAEAKTGRLRPRLDFSVVALLLALHFCYGVYRIHQVNNWETQRVRVLLVQENIPQTLKWDPAETSVIMQGYGDATEAAIRALEEENVKNLKDNINGDAVEIKQPDLVIWPESALPEPLFFVEGAEGVEGEISLGGIESYYLYGSTKHLLNERVRPLGNFTLITGMNKFEAELEGARVVGKEGGNNYNSIAVISPGGAIEDNIKTYDKAHLVLFGEYIPFLETVPFLRDLFKFSSGADFSGNFQAGRVIKPLNVQTSAGDMQIIPNVCFEDTVSRLTRKFVQRAPQVIVNVTNDGWFKESEAAAQHMTNAKFRAIELRRPMVRCANTGMSGIISMTGSFHDPVTGNRQVIEDDTGTHFVRSSLYGHAYAAKSGPITLFSLAGDWFSYLMIAFTVFIAIRARYGKYLR